MEIIPNQNGAVARKITRAKFEYVNLPDRNITESLLLAIRVLQHPNPKFNRARIEKI